MQRAIDLAQRGIGQVEPNPRVGCVIVHDNRIIGEGYHQMYGGPHAEVQALNSVAKADKHLLPDATLYVTLEPCAHEGKTPPCAHRIVQEKVGHVVIATLDPHDKVAGQGKAILEAAGTPLTMGILEKAAQAINRPFFTQHTQHRPYVTLKWAQSRDGFLGEIGKRTALTGAIANRITHRWRVEHKAILVGQETARIDNPRLTNHLWPGPTPLRIVWDPDGSLPDDLQVWDGQADTWVLTHDSRTSHPNAVIQVVPQDHWVDSVQAMLIKAGIQSVLVEGGSKTLHAFLTAGWWDEYRVWQSPQWLGDGVPAPILPMPPVHEEQIGSDLLMTGYRA